MITKAPRPASLQEESCLTPSHPTPLRRRKESIRTKTDAMVSPFPTTPYRSSPRYYNREKAPRPKVQFSSRSLVGEVVASIHLAAEKANSRKLLSKILYRFGW